MKLDEIKIECIDKKSSTFEIKWGSDPVKDCTHAFYEFNPKNGMIQFTFDDENYPEGQVFGFCLDDSDNENIIQCIRASIYSYLVGAGKIK